MRDQVHVCQDAESLAVHACHWLVDRIARHQADPECQSAFSLALAGGSTPKRLYQLLSEVPPGEIDWNRVLLLWGDERNVPPEHADSNYRMVKENLLDRIPIPAHNVLAVPDPGGDAQQAAQAYEQLLRGQLPAGEGKFASIDCVLLGMGDDVHTASLFPGTQAVHEQKLWAVGNHVPKLDTWRITLTAPLINAAKQVAFLINGANKMHALSLLWHAPPDPALLPAQLIRPHDGSLWFFLDKAAMADIPLPETVMVQLV